MQVQRRFQGPEDSNMVLLSRKSQNAHGTAHGTLTELPGLSIVRFPDRGVPLYLPHTCTTSHIRLLVYV